MSLESLHVSSAIRPGSRNEGNQTGKMLEYNIARQEVCKHMHRDIYTDASHIKQVICFIHACTCIMTMFTVFVHTMIAI